MFVLHALGGAETNFRPFRLPKFSRAHEYQRGKA
jgi:hypothetical protein